MRVASVIMNEISTFLLVQLRQNEKQYYIGEHKGDGGRQEALWTCVIASCQAWLMTTRETGPNKYVTQRCCKLFVGNSGCQFRNCLNSAESAVFSYLIYHKWQDKDKFDHHDGTFVLKSILGHICLNSRITKKPTWRFIERACVVQCKDYSFL